MMQSMLGKSSSYWSIVNQYTPWSTIWPGHNYPNEFVHGSSESHPKLTTTFLLFIPIYAKYSSTDITTVMTTSTNISGSQNPCTFPVLLYFAGLHTNFNGGIFPTKVVFSQPYYILWISAIVDGSFPFPPVLSVLKTTRMFIPFTCIFIYKIMWPWCIVT